MHPLLLRSEMELWVVVVVVHFKVAVRRPLLVSTRAPYAIDHLQVIVFKSMKKHARKQVNSGECSIRRNNDYQAQKQHPIFAREENRVLKVELSRPKHR